jgi:hypothetical protein
MSVIRLCLILSVMLPCLSGCVGVSMHSTPLTQVRVTDRATGKPVSGAKISVDYSYRSAGVFYLFRVPESASAETDRTGVAILPIATFNYDISFCVAGTHFLITPELVHKGGFPSGSYWSGGGQTGEPLVEHPPSIVVQLTPVK